MAARPERRRSDLQPSRLEPPHTGELVYLVYGKIRWRGCSPLLRFQSRRRLLAQPGPFLLPPLLARVAQPLELLALYRMLNVGIAWGSLLVLRGYALHGALA